MIRSLSIAAFACLVGLAAAQTSQPATAPAVDDATAAFRAYVAAIRAGHAAKVLERVEAVPETSRPLLNAAIRSIIAIEAVKTEMARQMGPPKLDEEGWNMGQMPDEILNVLREKGAEESSVVLVAADPGGGDATIAVMVKRDGVWRVPASLVLGEVPTPDAFKERDAATQAMLIKQCDAISHAAADVLKQLKAKAFKEPVDVQTALTQGMMRAGEK